MSKSRLPGDEDAGERRPGFRAAGASVARIVPPIVAHHGGGILTRLKSEWGAIVGPELAASCWPERLARDGALKLRVVPAKALELQHRAPLVIERINLFFGRAAITRLTLVQGPLPLVPAVPREASRPLGPGEAAALDRQLETVADPELRGALARLGRRIIGAAE
jgi:hypothetical protein